MRENSEGEYAGHGGISHRGEKWAVATKTSISTRAGVKRIMRFAFEVARARERKHLTVTGLLSEYKRRDVTLLLSYLVCWGFADTPIFVGVMHKEMGWSFGMKLQRRLVGSLKMLKWRRC